MPYPVGIPGYDALVAASERAWQSAMAVPGLTQPAATAATVARLQSIIAAGITFNVSTPNETSALASIFGPTGNV
jgi:hypothetical protein